MTISPDYVASKITQYTKRPLKLRHKNGYNFECPICNEGKSAGKKRRGFYNADDNYFYCHNCNRGWDVIKWIQTVCGINYHEIVEESQSYNYTTIDESVSARFYEPVKKTDFGTLPEDSINLFDDCQLNYYIHEPTVRMAHQIITSRRIDKAINKPKSIWVSLKDKIHKNRLCIPFYDEDNQIRFYQTRTILAEDMNDKPKYLSKLNAEKRVYGINNVNPLIDYLFIFEGPIDSMFIENGVAVCGLHLTESQQVILNKYALYEKIWVPDNQFIDNAAREKSLQMIDDGASVFIWPKELRQFKDLNEIVCKYQLNKIAPNVIINNTYKGLEAKTKLLMA